MSDLPENNGIKYGVEISLSEMFGQRYEFLGIQSWSHQDVLCRKAESGLWFLVPQFVSCTEVQIEVDIQPVPISLENVCLFLICKIMYEWTVVQLNKVIFNEGGSSEARS